MAARHSLSRPTPTLHPGGRIVPKHLKLIARFANSGALVCMALIALVGLGKGNYGLAVAFASFTALLGFNLYLVEKSAMLLSEEEWLKSEVRKVFLRSKLARLAREEAADGEQRP